MNMRTIISWPTADNRLLVWLHISMWLLIFLMVGAAFLGLLPLGQSILRATLNTLMMMVLFYGVGYFYHRFYEYKSYWAFGLSLVALFSFITLLRHFINLGFQYDESVRDYYALGPIPFIFGTLVTNVTALLISLLYQLLRARISLKQRQTELVAEQKEAKLQFLRAQMNPHFLFNTLNNIYSLAVVKSDKTAPLVLRLSELLQYVIYDAQKRYTPLSKEITVVEEYIALFQLQFEEPPKVNFDYRLPRRQILLEPLLLIPFVENCFKHADFAENPDAYTRLELTVEDNELSFVASNTYNPHQRQKDGTGGVGLENIRRRLMLQYPERHQLEVSSDKTVFTVRLQLTLPESE
jgi:two-component system LytT family sensor kinase